MTYTLFIFTGNMQLDYALDSLWWSGLTWLSSSSLPKICLSSIFYHFFSIFHTFSTRAPCLRMSYYLSWGLLFKFSTIPWVHYQTNFIVWLIQRTVFCQKKTVKELWYLVTLDDFFHWFHLLCCMSRLCTLWYWEDSDVGVKTFFNKMVISW